MSRHKDSNWTLPEGPTISFEAASLAVLMDIRDELKMLNRLLHCENFTRIPATLKSIDRKVTKPKRKRARNR